MKQRTSIAIDGVLRGKLEHEARRRRVSVSGLVNQFISDGLKRDPGAKRDPAFRPLPKQMRFKLEVPPGMTLDQYIDSVAYDRP
jgi:hypothetical protein